MRKAIVAYGDGYFLEWIMKQFPLIRWLPALMVMAVIFWFSSQPSEQLPHFEWADRLLKKLGHVLGYAILAVSDWYALGMRSNHRWNAWLLAILYAITDEFHQSFVPGRNPSPWDVLIFDTLGALLGLWMANRIIQQKRSTVPTGDRQKTNP